MADYDLRFGPLAFVAAADQLSETLGETLEAVGSTLTATERRARGLKLNLPVRAARQEINRKTVGFRLRAQTRELIENARWRGSGFFFTFAADPDLDCWLVVGGGELAETNLGVTFGEWQLDLNDVYVVGRPSTHRPARRFEVGDRRTGLVARDTRGRLFSTDHAAIALPTHLLTLPGDVTAVRLARGRTPSEQLGDSLGGRRLWRKVAATGGDVASYLPASSVLSPLGLHPYADLEAAGAVRVWDTTTKSAPINVATYTAAGDANPAVYGWTRIYGAARAAPDRDLAIDNGVCRLIWLGPTSGGGLALETFDGVTSKYVREGRLAGAGDVAELTVVEVTSERAVLEFRGSAGRVFRVVLERGWYGPRVEAYNDDGGSARLEISQGAASAISAGTAANVDVLTSGGRAVRWAKGTDADARTTFLAGNGTFLNTAGVAYSRTGVVVAQLGSPRGPATDTELAGIGLADARSIPTLVKR